MKNSSIKIAIIDSGLEKDNPHINYQKISYGWTAFENDFLDRTGHGTNIVKIIQENFSDADIVVIKIFDDRLMTKDLYIIQAINWCIENKIKMINLSVAISEFSNYYQIKNVCDRASDNGLIIVASAENTGKPCIPAYWDMIIGVGGVKTKDNLLYLESSSIQFYSRTKFKNYSNNIRLKGIYGTSFAAANVSGMLLRFVNNSTTINQAKYYLKKNSKKAKQNEIVTNSEFDFSKNTKDVYVNNNWNLGRFCDGLLHQSSKLEKYIFSHFNYRIKNTLGKVKYESIRQVEEEDLIASPYFLDDLEVNHIFRNDKPVIVILNISKYQHLSLIVINALTEYAARKGRMIKSIVKKNGGLFFKDIEYSYYNSIIELSDEKKYLLISALIDSIWYKYKAFDTIFMEIVGNVFSKNFDNDALVNQVVLLASKPSSIIIIGDKLSEIEENTLLLDRIFKKAIIKKVFVNQSYIYKLLGPENNLELKKANVSNGFFQISDLEDLYEDIQTLF